jgi:uncharacterized protein YlxW (UPF0749 family)
MRDRRSLVALTTVAFILGLLLVVQLRVQAGGSRLESQSAQDLTLLIANLNTENDDLRSEIVTHDRLLDDLESGRSSGETNVGRIRADLARIRAWAGLDPVAGRGVTITISGPVTALAVEDLMNELRAAGAEAIAIEDVRVVPGTVVGGGGGQGDLSVDDTLLGDPFVIRAIGRSETIVGSLTRIGGIVAQLGATYPDATVDVEATERMTLPATTRDLVPTHGRPRV